MVKYPVQMLIGGTLLLTLAVSLNDGSEAQTGNATQLSLQVSCPTASDRRSSAVRSEITEQNACVASDSKK